MYETDFIPGDLFASDALLPAQYYDSRSAELSPERRLMLALLIDAVRCYQTGVTSTRGLPTRVFADAKIWIFNGQRDAPFAFEDICDALEIDAGYLRRGLRSWRDRRLTNEGPRLIRRSPVILRKQVGVRKSRSTKSFVGLHRRQGSSSLSTR